MLLHKDSTKKMPTNEVHAHGFSWEKELLRNVYHATDEEMTTIRYTSKMDLPSEYNRLEPCDISIKTTGSKNAVCMADCLRVFDAVSSGLPFHLVVVQYNQTPNTKQVSHICEIDLTNSHNLLFGSLSRSQIEELDKSVKSVPQKRKPSPDEYNHMYSIRNTMQPMSGAIHLDIKCNSTQSRLQCSFNQFQKFIQENPQRIIATSSTNQFRGGTIVSELVSSRRMFKR
jgi:hypothetical protein